MTVMGDAWMDRLSDAGSIPARSIFLNREIWQFKGFAVFLIIKYLITC